MGGKVALGNNLVVWLCARSLERPGVWEELVQLRKYIEDSLAKEAMNVLKWQSQLLIGVLHSPHFHRFIPRSRYHFIPIRRERKRLDRSNVSFEGQAHAGAGRSVP